MLKALRISRIAVAILPIATLLLSIIFAKEQLSVNLKNSIDLTKYAIVYDLQNPYGIYYANLLNRFLESKGIKLPVAADAEAETDYEILLGDTSRYKTELGEQEYAVRLCGNKLVFEGGHPVMIEKAIKIFIANGKTSGDFLFSGTDTTFNSTVRIDV